MKKLASLLLALALCLALAIPAMADAHELYVYYENGDSDAVIGNSSGNGWSFLGDTGVSELTLNGLTNASVVISHLGTDPTVVLAAGSKNVLTSFEPDSLSGEEGFPIIFKGTGELIISDPSATENGVFRGFAGSVKLQDGLTMTGGTKEGDSGKLTFKAIPNEYYTEYVCMAGNQPATYIRIAPAAGAAKPQTPAKPSAAGFTDVTANSPYAEAIQWAVENGITTGTTPTTFSPNKTCTNRQVLTFLWRSKGRPGEEPNASEWTYVHNWGYTLGLLNLADFPDKPCTRADVIWTLWILNQQPKPSKSANFTDMPDSPYIADAISWAVEKGITTGTSATAFSPDNICTRGQVMTFLYRASK